MHWAWMRRRVPVPCHRDQYRTMLCLRVAVKVSSEILEGFLSFYKLALPYLLAEQKMSMMRRTSNLGSNIGSPGTGTITESKENSVSRIESVRKGINRAITTATNTLLMSAYDSFRFKDFCPSFFKEIRGLCGVDEDEYSSVFTSTTKERFSEGRSGAFMFFSANQKYIVKTTFKADMCSLYRILPKYVEYLRKNPNSLIVRFLGAHNITMYGVKLYFVVMLNVFTADNLSERYDLKGSWVNRHGFKGGRNANALGRGDKKAASVPLYQDNDLQHKISLHPDVIRPFARQVKLDSEFLRGYQSFLLKHVHIT